MSTSPGTRNRNLGVKATQAGVGIRPGNYFRLPAGTALLVSGRGAGAGASRGVVEMNTYRHGTDRRINFIGVPVQTVVKKIIIFTILVPLPENEKVDVLAGKAAERPGHSETMSLPPEASDL
jgi:hypothetical protein